MCCTSARLFCFNVESEETHSVGAWQVALLGTMVSAGALGRSSTLVGYRSRYKYYLSYTATTP